MRFLLVLIAAHFARFLHYPHKFYSTMQHEMQHEMSILLLCIIYIFLQILLLCISVCACPPDYSNDRNCHYQCRHILYIYIIIVIAKFIIITTLGATLDVTIPIKHNIKQIIMTTHIACITNPNINAPK